MGRKSIGIIISELVDSATSAIYKGISNMAHEYDYITYACLIRPNMEISKYFYEGEYRMFDILNFEDFDGLIVALNTINSMEMKEKLLRRIKAFEGPVIAIDTDIDGVYHINTRNYTAQRQLVDHLIEHHHCTKINYLSGPQDNEEAVERRNAYISSMKDHGLFQESRIFEGSFFVQDGEAALSYFEKDPVASDFKAIVCANDISALSVYEALMKRGYRIPEDVLVTGFDDIPESIHFYPPLTTYTKNCTKVGATSVELLRQLWSGMEIPQSTRIDGEVVLRESCGCQSDLTKAVQHYNEELPFFTEKQLFQLDAKSSIQSCIDSDSFCEFVDGVSAFIEKLQPEEFFLCIYEKNMVDFQIGNGLIYQTRLHFDEGRLTIPVAFCEGHFEDVVFMDRSKRLYTNHDRVHHQQYVLSPLHFRDMDFGFVVFAGSQFPFSGSGYWEWLQGLCCGLSSLRDRIELNRLYMSDSLTGLYNRYGLERSWKTMSEECTRTDNSLLAIFVDVDGLKKINDQYGHEEGDFAIHSVATVLREVTDHRMKASRYGGDEFLILGRGMELEDGRKVQQKIEGKLKAINEKVQKPYRVSVSSGCYLKKPEELLSLDECILRADKEMYQNKSLKHKQISI